MSLAALFFSPSDSSDDDLPIAQIAKKHKRSAAAIKSISDEDILLTDLPKKVKPRKSQMSIAAYLLLMGLFCLVLGSRASAPSY